MSGSRQRPTGWHLVLLAVVAAVWLACFALHLDAALGGRLAWIPMTTRGAAGAHEFPIVTGFWSPDVARGSALAPGDRLLAAGATSLEGSRGFATAARIYAAASSTSAVELRGEREGHALSAVLALRPVPRPWRLTIVAALLFAVAALIAWRASGQPAARLLFLSFVGYSLHLAYFWGADARRNVLAFVVFGAGLGLALPCALRGALSFPPDVARGDRLSRAWPWLFALVGIGAPSWAFGWPLPYGVGLRLTVGGSIAAIAAVAAILVVQWRRTGPVGRRQINWVLLGSCAAFAPPILFGTAALLRPSWLWLYELSVTSVILLPLAILIALVRDHLFDVDRLLTAAAGYTGVCVLLLGSIIGLVPRVASAFQGVIDPEVSEPALALGSAFLLLALRARLEPWIERRLFPERLRFERGAHALRDELARCEKPAELFVALGERLDALLAPESLIVFGRSVDAFAPLFERGPAVVPALALEGPLALELELGRRVIDTRSLSIRGRRDPLLEMERQALGGMGTELLVPVVADRLEAFVCLGPKRSGRDYGASELALLQSVADKAADELRRFGFAEVQRDQQELCERLRRYVPGALAARLADGRELPVGEREVTVLFVDIRGYVQIAERRDPRAVFFFVGRYARTLSEILQRYGGTLIDVQGDGLMAVFGAPEAQPEKERMALAAAREVFAALSQLRTDPDGRGDPIEVGIGIATGRAFVGNLATADRSIWCVVGDTVNLAARCQALTRQVDAWMVIDAPTYEAAGAPAELLPLPATAIRGRRARVDLYRLPGNWPAAALEAST